jgi:hypothetical protein
MSIFISRVLKAEIDFFCCSFYSIIHILDKGFLDFMIGIFFGYKFWMSEFGAFSKLLEFLGNFPSTIKILRTFDPKKNLKKAPSKSIHSKKGQRTVQFDQ